MGIWSEWLNQWMQSTFDLKLCLCVGCTDTCYASWFTPSCCPHPGYLIFFPPLLWFTPFVFPSFHPWPFFFSFFLLPFFGSPSLSLLSFILSSSLLPAFSHSLTPPFLYFPVKAFSWLYKVHAPQMQSTMCLAYGYLCNHIQTEVENVPSPSRSPELHPANTPRGDHSYFYPSRWVLSLHGHRYTILFWYFSHSTLCLHDSCTLSSIYR